MVLTMLTRLIVVIISQYIQTLNHWAEAFLYVNYISIFLYCNKKINNKHIKKKQLIKHYLDVKN